MYTAVEEIKARRILQERDQTQELLGWLRTCLVNSSAKIRTMTWMGTAVQHRINIVLEEYPELFKPESYEQILLLLEQHYLLLEQQVVYRLPIVEQLYYTIIVPNWRNIVNLMLECGAVVVCQSHDIINERIMTQVYIKEKISVEQFRIQIAHKWCLSNWEDCSTLFEIKH